MKKLLLALIISLTSLTSSLKVMEQPTKLQELTDEEVSLALALGNEPDWALELFNGEEEDIDTSAFDNLPPSPATGHDSDLFKRLSGSTWQAEEVSSADQSDAPGQAQLSQKIRCRVQTCTATFGSKQTECNHFRESHPIEYQEQKISKKNKQKNLFRCDFPECPKFFSQQRLLNDHKKRHNSSKPHLCAVKGCTEKFETLQKRDKHVKNHQDRAKNNFKCGKCGKLSNDKSNLLRHQKICTGNPEAS
ncbi:MAG: hypothetical protein LVQ75_03470 [Candidatus Babeliales bacterium]